MAAGITSRCSQTSDERNPPHRYLWRNGAGATRIAPCSFVRCGSPQAGVGFRLCSTTQALARLPACLALFLHQQIKDLLRQWRENNERRSEDVMEFWSTIMDDIGKLGNEKYVILEQVLYAALDTHTYSVSKLCISLLNQEFPDSMRVGRHKTAQLEAEDNYEDAMFTLCAMIKADETNAPARKRRIALKKGLGLIPEAIKDLVDYLKMFMSDVEAWQELCSLYLQVQEYGRAAFCAEEMILHQPHNHLMHQRLADIRYTMGGLENMELAKTYYCQALKLNPDNMRALLGLFLATNNLLNHYKSSGNSAKRAEVWKLCQHAQSQTLKKQKEAHGAPSSPPLSNLMLALAITD